MGFGPAAWATDGINVPAAGADSSSPSVNLTFPRLRVPVKVEIQAIATETIWPMVNW
jgi:hypothetical protein